MNSDNCDRLGYDPGRGAYVTDYDWTGDSSVTHEVIKALGAVVGTSPAEFDETLFDVIDTDALEVLFRPTNSDRRSTAGGVWFTFADHHILIDSSGRIEIYPPGRDVGHPPRADQPS